jgi:hypothetical protein
MTTWRPLYDRDVLGNFQQVRAVNVTVSEALALGFLDEISEHVGPCTDQHPRVDSHGSNYDIRLCNMDDDAICPRCFLLLAQRDDAHPLLKSSRMQMYVVVQIKRDSYFNHIKWGD